MPPLLVHIARRPDIPCAHRVHWDPKSLEAINVHRRFSFIVITYERIVTPKIGRGWHAAASIFRLVRVTNAPIMYHVLRSPFQLKLHSQNFHEERSKEYLSNSHRTSFKISKIILSMTWQGGHQINVHLFLEHPGHESKRKLRMEIFITCNKSKTCFWEYFEGLENVKENCINVWLHA